MTVVDPDLDAYTAERATRLSDGLSRLFRFGARMKAEIAAEHLDGRDLPTLVILHRLAEDGPLRAGALAERAHMDPSQVSRAVAALVREGAVERRADPLDGRATLLVATAAGRAAGERFARARAAYVGAIVADWDRADADALSTLLDRFVDGLDRLLPPRDGRSRDLPGGDGAAQATRTSTTVTPGAAQ
jgi:DNA-binding MarR family transcriptional regulator